jgi:hypothetical protein
MAKNLIFLIAISNWGIADGQVQAYVVDITYLCDSSLLK